MDYCKELIFCPEISSYFLISLNSSMNLSPSYPRQYTYFNKQWELHSFDITKFYLSDKTRVDRFIFPNNPSCVSSFLHKQMTKWVNAWTHLHPHNNEVELEVWFVWKASTRKINPHKKMNTFVIPIWWIRTVKFLKGYYQKNQIMSSTCDTQQRNHKPAYISTPIPCIPTENKSHGCVRPWPNLWTNTNHSPNSVLMLIYRLRRWPDI